MMSQRRDILKYLGLFKDRQRTYARIPLRTRAESDQTSSQETKY
jgi:hypothetical protein